MSDIAIRVAELGKQYHIGKKRERYIALRDVLADAFVGPFRRAIKLLRGQATGAAELDEIIWALKEVSFEIKQGEVVGIIGCNGAGKSTLLKILSRITEPTEGYAEVHGRVGSLLEVGTGFHPELTGRENIYLNGAILGMRKAEIERKFDEIVDFAEIEKFLDTPVKHYSSGMYVRLAFAVAAHLEPEILLVDEVLAVGDIGFQKKCLSKIGAVAREGRTVIVVSHNMAVVQNLCQRALLLVDGKLDYVGITEDCVRRYMEATPALAEAETDLSCHPVRRRGCLPLLNSVRLTGRDGNPTTRFLSGEMMKIELKFNPVIQLDDPQFGVGVDDWMGTRIFSVATYFTNSQLPALREPCTITCCIKELPLVPGHYSLSLSAGTNQNPVVDNLVQVVSFDVEGTDFFGNGRIPHESLGRVLVRSHWVRNDKPG